MICLILGLQGSFLNGTLIDTPTGLVKIENCRTIYSMNKDGKRIITNCLCSYSGRKQIYSIVIDNKSFQCSPEHSFPIYDVMTKSIQVVQAKYLKIDRHFMFKYDNTLSYKYMCKITSITKTKKTGIMYDLIVPEFNNFILENGIITHNSGKTCACVREMFNDATDRTYFSNIKTSGKVKNNILIKPEMIIKKEPVMTTKGDQAMKNGEPVYKYLVNREFWEEASKKYKGLNVIIDEAHSILNARRAMMKSTQPILDWISLLRRVLGSTESGYGKLYLITQIERRLDVVAKEQSTEVRFHMCHYQKICKRCGWDIVENNEQPDPIYNCPRCAYELKKINHVIEVWHFKSYVDFIHWKYLGKGKTYYKHYMINDIENYFPLYNTLQWDNLLTDI